MFGQTGSYAHPTWSVRWKLSLIYSGIWKAVIGKAEGVTMTGKVHLGRCGRVAVETSTTMRRLYDNLVTHN